MIPRILASFLFWSAAMGPATSAEVTYRILSFNELQGWREDDHDAAFSVFLSTCGDMGGADWQAICGIARKQTNSRIFFEAFSRPVLMEDGMETLFTGYYEPELDGSLTQQGRYQYPIYRLPTEVTPGQTWSSRRDIEEQDLLAGQGLEIAWIDDPVDVYFLHVQGSGRVKLQDGTVLRVGYGGKNGQPYRSRGQELVRQGIFDLHQVSAQVIKNWVHRNPEDGIELLRHNPSYVFFRQVDEIPSHRGPLGAMNRSIAGLRSIAIDPSIIQLGAPVWVEKDGKFPMYRLMVAQDTGSVIKGAQRADIFFGTGIKAGRQAARVKDNGRMIVLLPIERAYKLAQGI